MYRVRGDSRPQAIRRPGASRAGEGFGFRAMLLLGAFNVERIAGEGCRGASPVTSGISRRLRPRADYRWGLRRAHGAGEIDHERIGNLQGVTPGAPLLGASEQDSANAAPVRARLLPLRPSRVHGVGPALEPSVTTCEPRVPLVKSHLSSRKGRPGTRTS